MYQTSQIASEAFFRLYLSLWYDLHMFFMVLDIWYYISPATFLVFLRFCQQNL